MFWNIDIELTIGRRYRGRSTLTHCWFWNFFPKLSSVSVLLALSKLLHLKSLKHIFLHFGRMRWIDTRTLFNVNKTKKNCCICSQCVVGLNTNDQNTAHALKLSFKMQRVRFAWRLYVQVTNSIAPSWLLLHRQLNVVHPSNMRLSFVACRTSTSSAMKLRWSI